MTRIQIKISGNILFSFFNMEKLTRPGLPVKVKLAVFEVLQSHLLNLYNRTNRYIITLGMGRYFSQDGGQVGIYTLKLVYFIFMGVVQIISGRKLAQIASGLKTR